MKIFALLAMDEGYPIGAIELTLHRSLDDAKKEAQENYNQVIHPDPPDSMLLEWEEPGSERVSLTQEFREGESSGSYEIRIIDLSDDAA